MRTKKLKLLVLGYLLFRSASFTWAQTVPIAEVVTPRIQALADGLQHDPLRIFNYVHDNVRHVLYFGSKKGAELTLLEKSGNDFDQSALLVALLRAAGYTNSQWSDQGVGYQFGWAVLPYDNPDGSHRDLHHWLGLSLTNSNWNYTKSYLGVLFKEWRFYPLIRNDLGDNLFAFQRVWVTLTTGGTNYYLDPAFKVSEPIAGIPLTAAMGSTVSGISNTLMTAAGGVSFGNLATNFYTSNLNDVAIADTLRDYTSSILGYLRSNYPNASVEQILGEQHITPSTNTELSQALLFPGTNMNGTMPVMDWANQPTNMMSTMEVSFVSMTYKWFMPQLSGQRISLTVSNNGMARLWQDDKFLTNISTGGGSGSFSLGLRPFHPGWHGSWDTNNNLFIPAPSTEQGFRYSTCQNLNANYAILYSFEPDLGWLRERQRKLDDYRQQGYTDTSRQVVTETLNIMGLNWELQDETVGRLVGQQLGALPQHAHRMGRMAQETGKGYYVDVYDNVVATCSDGSSDGGPTIDPISVRWTDLATYFASAMEHGMIEQLQNSNLIAASTVKVLQFANTNHQAIYLARASNWSAVQGKLSGYTISSLTALINAGYTILLPKNCNNNLGGSGGWSGYGFMVQLQTGDQALIGRGLFGGYVGTLSATINPSFINYSAYSQPSYFTLAPTSLPSLTGADPVNLVDGTFQEEAPELSLGQTEPRGLNFSRYYSSARRNSNLAAMSPGWLHNYYLKAASISAPEAGLGGTTPAQMAPMLVAITSALSVYNGTQPDPKNWLVTALISKWGIDQLTAKAVSVSLGKDTLQFIQQPDGTYTPPANCTMSLLKTNAAYWLLERNGRTFKFKTNGWATNIIDQYNQTLRLFYNASNWVTNVTDWKGRSLTLNYSTTAPKRMTNVIDSTGRSVFFGYSSSNDLASVINVTGKTNTFLYDTNHQITATYNALGQLVASNIYDGFGRVTTQYTQGDTNKMWRIFWSGTQTVEQDPAGGQREFNYDEKSRLVRLKDQLGQLSRMTYDGQNHVVMTISPSATNQFFYDGNNNLVASIDALGFTNQFFYDTQNQLTQSVDARGNYNGFGYNTKHQLTGMTNGAGDWATFIYSATDGTLTNQSDAGGSTAFGYDGYGQLNTVTYPEGLGNVGLLNSTNGDVLSSTNARGFVTTFQYNARRQLTNTTAPTNLVTKMMFDVVGNAVSATDARGNTVSNLWSPTQKPIATIFPSTPQGTPIVTNIYDSRDWLIRTVDPQLAAMNYTNDNVGRVVSVTDPLLRTTHIVYDGDGRQIRSTNAAQELTQLEWNARSEKVKSIDGAGHTISSVYDEVGNQIVLTNRNGKKWQFQFDAANRLTNTITPLSRQTTLTYDTRGLLKTIKEPSSETTTNSYDAKGRLTNRADSAASRTYRYDLDDNLTNIVEAGKTNLWTFDAYDRVSTYRDNDGNLIQYRYDQNHNLTNLTYPDGKIVKYFYDNLNRLTNVTDWAAHQTIYTYNLANRLTGITRPNGTRRTNNYDVAGQLTNAVELNASGSPIAFFRYNWNSNLTMQWEFIAPLPHANTPTTQVMQYDDDNRLATFNSVTVTYDDDGNMLNGPLNNGTFANYGFDVRNRLLGVSSLSYGYDAMGNRTSITNGTNVSQFVINPNAALSQTLIRVKNGVTTYYVYGLGLLYEVDASGNTKSYHYDSRGSTVVLTADSGNVIDRIEYSAYGLTTYRASTNDTPFLYNGRYGVQTDDNGLLYMRARYYNPFLCRFINADPSGFSGGLNFYAYGDGNPVSMVDPFGLGASAAASSAAWIQSLTPSYLTALQDDARHYGDGVSGQNLAAGALNVVTLGLAGDVSSAFTGYDLYNNPVTRQEQILAAVSLAINLIPLERVGSAASRVATKAETIAAKGAVARNPNVYEALFESPISGTSRAAHRASANDFLATQLRNDSQLSGMFNQELGGNVLQHMESGSSGLLNPSGTVWHHPFDNPNVMQLLRTSEHTAPSLQPVLHPGGVGGFGNFYGP